MKLLAGVAAAAIGAAGATGAQAQDWMSGWYVGADVGYAWSEGIDADSDVNAADGQPYNWTFDNEDNVVGFGRLGYRFNPNWRAELEGGYRKSDIESVLGIAGRAQPVGLCQAGVRRTAAAPTCAPPLNGELRVGTAMFNVLYDFDMGYALKPFIGLGVGWAEVHNKVYGQLSGVPAGAAPFQNTNFDDIDGAMAGQVILGVTYELSPNWAVDFTGRYLRTADLEFGSNTQNAGGFPGGGITHVGTFEGNYQETSATIGMRYTFAAPPPPPPPPMMAPPPPPPPPPATQTCPDGSVILATDACPVAPPPPPPPPVEPVRG